MIGVVIVTHARLAEELRRAAELILGPQPALQTVNIEQETSVDEARRRVVAAVEATGADGEGVLILTDLFGGTPTNISAELLQKGRVEILAGVNLPMLLKCSGARTSHSLEELTLMLKEYTRTAIVRPLDLLS
mgnify:CR=1 FL=1